MSFFVALYDIINLLNRYFVIMVNDMINILICDDEQSFQEILTFKINNIMKNNIMMDSTIKCVNSLSNLEYELKNNHYDIVFLDIMVNNENSIDWMINNSIDTLYNTKFIIMTSFPIESYKISEINFCYYLIKTKMDNEQFQKALVKAINGITKRNDNKKIIKIGSKNYTVNIQDITYIETFNNNIAIHMTDESILTIYSTLKDFEKELTPNFLRCHKCYMINMNHIIGYEPHKFIINKNIFIPIPPKKYSNVVEKYKNYLLNL